jgi:ABC-type multidrug transport system ATPase subunit/uncharacterized membrane protein YccF (DUF307 family)
MRAEGSSLHLKQEFGLGYTLVIARESHQTPTTPIKAFVSKYLKSGSAQVVSDHLTELALQLPLSDISRFPSLLRGCDKHAAELGVTHFVLGMTTLEEVFLRLENEKVVRSESRESNHDLGRSFEERRARYRLEQQDRPVNLQRKDGGRERGKRQLMALLRKRLLVTARDPSRVVVLMLASLVMCAFAAVLLGTLHYEDPGCAAYVKQSPLLELSLNGIYGGGFYGGGNADTSSSMKLPMQSPLYAKFQADAALASMLPAAVELLDAGDSCAEVNTSVLQNRESALGAFCAPGASGVSRSSGLVMYNAFSGAHLLPALFSLWDAAQSNESAQVYSQPWPQSSLLSKSGETSIQSMLVFSLILVLAWSLLPAAGVAPIIKERAEGVSQHLYISGMSAEAYWLANFLHDYLLYLVQCALLFPILYLVPGSRAAFFSSGGQAGATICMFLLHGIDSTLFNYYWTSHSKNYATSFGSCMSSACGPFFFYSIAATTLITLQVSGAIPAGTVSNFNTVFFAFSPFSALAFALWSIANAAQIRCPGMGFFDFEATGLPLLYMVVRVLVVAKLLMRVDKQSPFAKHLAAKEVDPAICAQEEDADVHAMRRQTLELVQNAREEEDRSGRPPPRLLMWGIRKEYPPWRNSTGANGVKVAVNNLSLHLRCGECLGLLGPNGAGKTTTLSMIVGDVEPSCGSIRIGDERNLFDVTTQRAEAQSMLGLCPQFDVLTHSLTVEEHLTLHGQLKNLPEEELNFQTQELLARLDLARYRARCAGTLSGGNKRKLSLGIALIGDPAVVMLDEPSTGMDPAAKRFFWDVILGMRDSRAVILTTHSMEEADQLATTISVMVDGRMRCCASPVSLRAKYGTGFKMELKAGDLSKVSEARRIIEQQLPHAKVEEQHGRNLCYTVARAPTPQQVEESKDEGIVANNVDLGDVFSTMLAAAAASDSKEMAVSQDSLEQIFLLFAKSSAEFTTITEAPSVLKFKPGPCFVNYLKNSVWCLVSFLSVGMTAIWAAFVGPILTVVSWLLSKLIAVPCWLISPSAAPTPFPFQRVICQLLVICVSPCGRELHGSLPKYEVRYHHLANAIWLVLVGLPLASVHMAWGVVQCCTYVLIPVARIEFSLASICVKLFFVPMSSSVSPPRGRNLDINDVELELGT